jgi:hypothetical protein
MVEQPVGADDSGHRAAAVEVADHHHGQVERLGQVHVGDVAGTQVDLGAGAGALDHHQVGLLGHPCSTGVPWTADRRSTR